MLAAETGSGKSLAFLLPTLGRLATPDQAHFNSNEAAELGGCVLVLAPTRELVSKLINFLKKK